MFSMEGNGAALNPPYLPRVQVSDGRFGPSALVFPSSPRPSDWWEAGVI